MERELTSSNVYDHTVSISEPSTSSNIFVSPEPSFWRSSAGDDDGYRLSQQYSRNDWMDRNYRRGHFDLSPSSKKRRILNGGSNGDDYVSSDSVSSSLSTRGGFSPGSVSPTAFPEVSTPGMTSANSRDRYSRDAYYSPLSSSSATNSSLTPASTSVSSHHYYEANSSSSNRDPYYSIRTDYCKYERRSPSGSSYRSRSEYSTDRVRDRFGSSSYDYPSRSLTSDRNRKESYGGSHSSGHYYHSSSSPSSSKPRDRYSRSSEERTGRSNRSHESFKERTFVEENRYEPSSYLSEDNRGVTTGATSIPSPRPGETLSPDPNPSSSLLSLSTTTTSATEVSTVCTEPKPKKRLGWGQGLAAFEKSKTKTSPMPNTESSPTTPIPGPSSTSAETEPAAKVVPCETVLAGLEQSSFSDASSKAVTVEGTNDHLNIPFSAREGPSNAEGRSGPLVSVSVSVHLAESDRSCTTASSIESSPVSSPFEVLLSTPPLTQSLGSESSNDQMDLDPPPSSYEIPLRFPPDSTNEDQPISGDYSLLAQVTSKQRSSCSVERSEWRESLNAVDVKEIPIEQDMAERREEDLVENRNPYSSKDEEMHGSGFGEARKLNVLMDSSGTEMTDEDSLPSLVSSTNSIPAPSSTIASSSIIEEEEIEQQQQQQQQQEEEEELPLQYPLLPSKEEVLLGIEKLDAEITNTQSLIQNLRNPKRQETHRLRYRDVQSVIQRVYEENKEKLASVASSSGSLIDGLSLLMSSSSITPKGPESTSPLYREPSELPDFHRNAELYSKLAARVSVVVSRRREELQVKGSMLRDRYQKLSEKWRKRLVKLGKLEYRTPKKRRRTSVSAVEGTTEENSLNVVIQDSRVVSRRPLLRSAGKTFSSYGGSIGSSSNGMNIIGSRLSLADAVCSEAEFAEIMSQLREEDNLNPECKFLKTVAKIPSMVLAEERIAPFRDSNGLIEDPLQVERDRKLMNPWTDEEKLIFLKKFLRYPKNFVKISTYLKKKTTADVISYYYLNKKTLDLKKLLREQQMRKRGFSRVPTRVIAAAFGGGSKEIAHLNSWSLMEQEKGHTSTVRSSSSSSTGVNHRAKVETQVNFQDDSHQESDSPERKQHRPSLLGISNFADQTRNSSGGGGGGVETDTKWTQREHELFLEAIRKFSKDFKAISEYLGTKSSFQCRNYYHNSKKKLRLAQDISAAISMASSSSTDSLGPSPKRKVGNPRGPGPGSGRGKQRRIRSSASEGDLVLGLSPEESASWSMREGAPETKSCSEIRADHRPLNHSEWNHATSQEKSALKEKVSSFQRNLDFSIVKEEEYHSEVDKSSSLHEEKETSRVLLKNEKAVI